VNACVNGHHYLQKLAIDAGLPGCERLSIQSEADTNEAWKMITDVCEISEEKLASLVAARFDIEVADLESAVPTATKLLPASLANKYQIFPIRDDNNQLMIATSDPFNVEMERLVRVASSRRPVTQILGPTALAEAIQRRYSPDREAERLLQSLPSADGEMLHVIEASEPELVGSEEALSSPVVKLTNLIIREAIEQGASDVHLQPTATGAVARFRVDGVLRNFMRIPALVLNRVISRIKIIGNMDITIRFQPQDGRARIVADGVNYDLRISTVPTRGAEKAVIRIPAAQSSTGLGGLTMPAEELANFRQLMTNREGIVVVTGPTGSGKTTTMYGALQELSSEELNIMTIEDPVEYELSGFTQIQVDTKQGMTFASAMRAVLRQDPDVIFVGEIRDRETAEIAVQASLTGHLVLATVHANSAIGAIRRLSDLGLDNASIGDTLRGSLAQRLARKVCTECSEPVEGELTEDEQRLTKAFGVRPIVRAIGCEACGHSGYRGRIPFIEVFTVDSNIEQLVYAGAPSSTLQQAAIESGMREMRDVALQHIRDGNTTMQEIERVLGDIGAEDTVRTCDESSALDNSDSEADDEIHVLVVDDDGASRTIARALLEREGYRVSEAADGAGALEQLSSGTDYTLIVLDLDMPNVSGREVLKEVRSTTATAGLPVIVLTGNNDDSSEIELMQQGADDYIRKPLEPSRFLARVGATLRRTGG